MVREKPVGDIEELSKAKPGYKLVKWYFGKEIEIPEDWGYVKLEKYVNIISGDYFQYSDFVASGIPVLKIENVMHGKIDWTNSTYVPNDFVEFYKDSILNEHDIVLALNRPITHNLVKVSRLSKRDVPSLLYQRVGKFVFKNTLIEKSFFFTYLNSTFFKLSLSRILVGSDQPYVKTTELLKQGIGLPNDIHEQKKIALILNSVDELLNHYDKILDFTKKLKTGLIQQLLTKGIGHKKFKKVKWYFGKEIEIPIEWELKQVKDITNINSEQIKDNYPHEEIEYVDISSINNFQITHLEKYKTSERPSRAQRLVKESDIIISTVRPYLESFSLVSLNLPNLICSTGFSVLHSKHESDTNFLFNYFLSSFFKISYVKHMEGMAYPAITSSVIAQSLIPTPNDENERKQIGEILLKVNSKISNLELNKSSLNKIKKGLMQKLLTGQIRVAA